MEKSLLQFVPVVERPDLVSISVLEMVQSWPDPVVIQDFLVAEIDPNFSGGIDLCERYGIDPTRGANCLVVQGIRGQTKTVAACVVPVGFRYDMSGVVRKQLSARTVSVAPLDFVLEKTNMEYGSITPIGLPHEWLVFIDPLVLAHERIIVGSGLKKSKLSIPSLALLRLPGASALEGLAI